MATDEAVQVLGLATESVSAALVKAEIDQQISTAKTYPRSVDHFLREISRLVTLNEVVADECIYALPRKEGGQTKMIEGPSARFGELVLHAWRNCRAGARVVDEGPEFITAQGFFHDLEGNVAITREVRRRITTSKGQRYSADMIAVTANAACSIAQRNATFAGIPKALWTAAYERARAIVAGSAETFAKRRGLAMDHLGKMGVPPERVFARLGIGGLADMTTEHLVTLRGVSAAIRDNEIDVDEAFPGEKVEAPAAKSPGVAGLRAAMESKPAPSVGVPAAAAATISTEPFVVNQNAAASIVEPLPLLDAQPMCSAPGCTNEGTVKDAAGASFCETHGMHLTQRKAKRP
jgi:hypothetical protein